MADLNKSLTITIDSIFKATGFNQLFSGIKKIQAKISKPLGAMGTQDALSQMGLGTEQIKALTSDFKKLTQTESLSELNTKTQKLTSRFKELQNIGVGTQQFKEANVWMKRYGATLSKTGQISELTAKRGKAIPLRMEQLATAIADPVKGFKTFQGVMNQVNSGNMITREQFKLFGKEIKSLGGTVSETRSGFAMYALGLMFGGMQIMRMFQRILTMGVMTFMQLTEGQGEAAMGLTALAANFTLLKFTIGNAIATALLPLLPLITNIIQVIGDWISRHSKLTAIIIFGGFILGAFFMILGQGWLFVQALKSATIAINLKFKVWFKTMKTKGKLAFTSFGQKINWLTKVGFPALISGIKKVALQMIVSMKRVALFMLTNPIGIAILAILAILAFFLIKWKGNWEGALANIMVITGKIAKWVIKWVVKLLVGIIGVFDVGWASVVEGFQSFANMLLNAWNKLMGFFGAEKLKIDFRFEGGAIDAAKERFKKAQESINKMMNKAFDPKIQAWENVMDEWTEVIAKEEALKTGVGLPGGISAPIIEGMPTLEAGELELEMKDELLALELESLGTSKDKVKEQEDLNTELEKTLDLLKGIGIAGKVPGMEGTISEFDKFKARTSATTI